MAKKPAPKPTSTRKPPSNLLKDAYLAWVRQRAADNLAKWGVQDVETLGLAVAEEAGELAQAILQARFEGGSPMRIIEESCDLAALCLQVFVTMSGPRTFLAARPRHSNSSTVPPSHSPSSRSRR
jgi:hypothetical protein